MYSHDISSSFNKMVILYYLMNENGFYMMIYIVLSCVKYNPMPRKPAAHHANNTKGNMFHLSICPAATSGGGPGERGQRQ